MKPLINIAVIALVAAAQAQESPIRKPLITSDLGGRELAFLTKANEQGVLMNYLADLAKTKSESKPVQALGDLLASTQAEENSRLIQLSSIKGLNFAVRTPLAIKKLAAKLDPLKGADFDKACLAELVALSKEVVANYEAGAQSKDAEVKAFADEGLPLAQQKLGVTNKVAAASAPPAK